jgi:hypothetical protein
MVCIRIGTEIVGPMFYIVSVQLNYWDLLASRCQDSVPTHAFCEHDVDVQCVQLPKDMRKELAQTEPLYSGDIMFVAGEARSVAA